VNTKYCKFCNSQKPEIDFNFYNKVENKRHTKCKSCTKLYHNLHYKLNKDKYLKKGKESQDKLIKSNSDYVNNLKSKKGCSYCNEHDFACLDFHHIDPNTKKFSIARAITSYGLELILKEIQKCEIICSNCHRKLHAGRSLIKVDNGGTDPQNLTTVQG